MADSSLDDAYLDAIKGFEGYSPRAQWDYAQHTNGYGTRAAYPGEVIDRDTAEQRFKTEISKAASSVDAAFPQLPEGARAALTSLTYNAGPGWINGGLGKAVSSGDWGTARDLFLQYNHAGGQVLPGLTNRRAQEAAWLTGAQGPQPQATQQPQQGPLSAASLGAATTPAGVPLTARAASPGLQAYRQQADDEDMQALMPNPMAPTQFAQMRPLLRSPGSPLTQFLRRT